MQSIQDGISARLSDMNGRIADGQWLTTLVLTLLGIATGVAAYWTAGQRARESAHEWLSNHTDDIQRRMQLLDAQLKELEIKAGAAKQFIDETQTKIGSFAMETEKKSLQVQALMQSFQNDINAWQPTAPTGSQQKDDAEEAVKAKPENEYSASDWAKRAKAEVARRRYEQAAVYFGEAAAAPGIEDASKAEMLVSRGISFMRMMRFDDALNVFKDVVQTYGEREDAATRAQIVRASGNMGIALVAKNEFAQAILYLDKAIAIGSDMGDPNAEDFVAISQAHKAYALSKLGRHTESIELFDVALEKLKKLNDPGRRLELPRALFRKAAMLIELGRFEDGLAIIRGVISDFEGDDDQNIREFVAHVRLYSAPLFFSLGRQEEGLKFLDDTISNNDSSPDAGLRDLANQARDLKQQMVVDTLTKNARKP